MASTISIPIAIPSSSTVPTGKDSLAERCRQLARSVGHEAVHEQQKLHQQAAPHQYPSPDVSPQRGPQHLPPPLSPSSTSTALFMPINTIPLHEECGAGTSTSTRARAPSISSYPTPEGGSFLDEIMEEETEDEGGQGNRDNVGSSSGASPDPSSTMMMRKSAQSSRRGSRGSLSSNGVGGGAAGALNGSMMMTGMTRASSNEDLAHQFMQVDDQYTSTSSRSDRYDLNHRSSRGSLFGFGSLKLFTSLETEHESNLRNVLREGASYVVVPISLFDGQITVQNDKAHSLDNALTSIYLNQLLDIFREDSTSNSSPAVTNFASSAGTPTISLSGAFHHHRRRSSTSSGSGPFHNYPQCTNSHPFLLLLDIQSGANPNKSDPPSKKDGDEAAASTTLQFVQHALLPLLDAGLLTTYCPKSQLFTQGPIMVLITGVSVRNLVARAQAAESNTVETTRCVFFEAEIGDSGLGLNDSMAHAMTPKELTPVIGGDLGKAVLAGGQWNGEDPLNSRQKEVVRQQVKEAKERGLKIRYDGIPKFPTHVRELITTWLANEGVDYL